MMRREKKPFTELKSRGAEGAGLAWCVRWVCQFSVGHTDLGTRCVREGYAGS